MKDGDVISERAQNVIDVIEARRKTLGSVALRKTFGVVTEADETIIRVAFEGLRIGDICRVLPDNPEYGDFLAEVLQVENQTAKLFPLTAPSGVKAGTLVERVGPEHVVPVGEHLLGQIVDGLGQPISTFPEAPEVEGKLPLYGSKISPMDRPLIERPFVTGIRAIDGLATLGHGQRICMVGAAGTGKSTLMAAIARNSDCDVVVLGLIGERGREVREFVERHLPEEARGHVVVVASTSEKTAAERFFAAHTASTIADYFRDQGKSVLIILDSLTRVARALREIGLALGQPPTRRGYPASVYPQLPKLIERAGRTPKGDITAIYTVLMEGEQEDDPIVEEVKSLTDGHISLSREIAQAGRFPAIDPLSSLSRIMTEITDDDHQNGARHVQRLLAKYQEIQILIQVGEYQPGADPLADEAVDRLETIQDFLQQDLKAAVEYEETKFALQEAVQ